jgi:6-phosphofructokinase
LKIGIVVTGGAVSVALLNATIATAAEEIITQGGTPYLLSGGWGAILAQGLRGVHEVTPSVIKNLRQNNHTSYVTDRRLPRRSKEELDEVISRLNEKQITRLIVIGGNGSASALIHLFQHNPTYFTHLVQILKTMDGDCVDPFYNLGFSSTLHHACRIFRAYDSETSLYGSPYVVKMLGREVGQLCLHAGLRERPGLALVREEFGEKKLTFKELSLLLVASSLKQLACTGSFGTILLSEGIIDCLDEKAQKKIGIKFVTGLGIKRIDFTKAHLEASLKDAVSQILGLYQIMPFGVPLQVGSRSIGYYARAEEPDDKDLALAKSYGTRAARFCTQSDRMLHPVLLQPHNEVPLQSILNARNEVEQCWVDTSGTAYQEFVSKQYRLLPEDLEGETLDRICAYTSMTRRKIKSQLRPAAELFSQLPLGT